MSRCFPFPPPGYEKKTRSSSEQGGGDLLAKEKHKEKKHKKEKDKEKGESKDRKDKDRSKNKHKEKKDGKEKHKDKKKDKDRDKDKSKTPEDRRTEHRVAIHHEGMLGYDSRKAVEVGDSKFTEELGRRIRDDEQVAATRMVDGFSSTMHRRTESMGASTVMGKECITGNKMVTDVSSTMQRMDDKLAPSFQKKAEGMETATTLEKQKGASSSKVPDFNSMVRRNENLTPPLQKRTESMGTATVMEKQRAASNHKVGDYSSAEQRNHVTGRPMENRLGSVKRKIEGMPTFNSMQKERIVSNCTASSPMGAAMKRNDGMVHPVESVTSAVPGRTEIRGVTPAMKERPVFTNIVRTDQKRTDGMGLSIEKDRPAEKGTDKKLEGKEKTKEKDPDKKLEGKEKTKQKKAEDGKRERHKDKDRHEKKRKEKDKDRHKEKKKEEKRGKNGEHKNTGHDKVTENGMKDQIDSLINKILAPHIENVEAAGADGNIKKRKELEINGFLHERQHDGRPNKLPRTSASSSHSPVDNERLEFSHIASTCPSIKMGSNNNMKAKRGVDNNSNHVNGKAEAQPSHALGSSVLPVAVNSSKSDPVLPKLYQPPVAVEPKKSDQVPSRPQHPDTKYLSTIYDVPKMEELEFDDQEWLFSSENPRPNPKLEDTETPPQVWARGLQIEAADVFALPYVVPF